MSVSRLPIALLLSSLLAASPVLAKGPDNPSPGELAKAKKHYQTAKVHHDAGEYVKAAVEYQRAYDLFANEEFLYNIGQVRRLAGEKEAARTAYQAYIDAAPGGRAAEAARKHIADIDEELRKEDEARRKAEEAARAEALAKEEAAKEAQQNQLTSASTATDEPKDRGKNWRYAGIATAGVGVVALGLGINYGLTASSKASEVEDDDVWNQQAYDEGEDANFKMKQWYAIGAASLAVGGALYYIGHSRKGEPKERMAVTPVLGADMNGLSFHGNF